MRQLMKIRKNSVKQGAAVVLGLAALAVFCYAIRISVTGSWTETIDVNDLRSVAGSDLNSTYSSATNQVIINVTEATLRWEVRIRRVDSNWQASFTLSARRTSSHRNVIGGTAYLTVTTSDQRFFYTNSNNNNPSNINIQYRLSGVSVQIPPGTYTTTVYYTIVETG